MIRKIFALFILPFFLLIIPSKGDAIKPLPPLQMSLLQVELAEEKVQITLTARANINSRKVSLAIRLPLGVPLIEGEEEWEGPLKKGETKRVKVVIQNLRGLSQEITSIATIFLEPGGTFVQRNKLTLNPSLIEAPPPTPPIRGKEGGNTILQFKGK